MDGKAAIIFPILAAFIMSVLMSAAITVVNLGFTDFFIHWARAWAFAFPLAVAAAFFALPLARRLTIAIVSRIESGDRP